MGSSDAREQGQERDAAPTAGDRAVTTTQAIDASQARLSQPGERFLRFQLGRLIGRGGNGEVHEVIHQGQAYALKRVHTKGLDDEDQQRRVLREGQLLELIHHPNVVARRRR
jgi:serine/threonine protein kinase